MMKRFVAFAIIALAAVVWIGNSGHAVEADPQIDAAMFRRETFFGAEAIVPIPSREALRNLESLRSALADNPNYLETLAETAERVGELTIAEDSLKSLAQIRPEKIARLADFYSRRGLFERQAELWASRLENGSDDERPAALANLIAVARRHGIDRFVSKEYLTRVVSTNAGNRAVIESLVEAETDPLRILELSRAARATVTDVGQYFLKKEIAALRDLDRDEEAESVYLKAFDPFWDDDLSQDFYYFLSDRDRLRAYGRELRSKFRDDPSNIDAAVRYAHFLSYDANLGGDSISSIAARLETAKTSWTTGELVTVTRLLIRENAAADASRFLYALSLKDDFKAGSDKRSQVLYQLFELLVDAGERRVPIAKGDLGFYRDVARADTDPGIMTGIMSLLFADTKPGERLETLESEIAGDFNRAGAFRVFLAFREENPASPLLAQMRLDLVRVYAAKKETKVAGSLLNEFSETFEKSTDFPLAAIKLADAYAAVGDPENERATLQRVLDHIGGRRQPLTPVPASGSRNAGTDSPAKKADATRIKDYLDREEPEVSYSETIDRIVASFSRQRKTAEILGLYSAEIAKYPDEQWLYERRLSWLETAGLTDDQIELYRAALARFKSRGWQDRFARFLIRRKRSDEFAALATDLAGRLNEAEAEEFLSFATSNDIGGNLSLSLYTEAHRRFPRNIPIVMGLMRIHRTLKNETEWRRLAAENFFQSDSIRREFLEDLARRGELQKALRNVAGETSGVAEFFRAEANARLSDFESAAASFAKLDQLYPARPEFNDRALELARSFGQRDREALRRAADLARERADRAMDDPAARTVAGEILAEAGNYDEANAEWLKIITTSAGDRNAYLDTASVMWDYYQFAAALKVLDNTRTAFRNPKMFAFEAGSIRQSLGDRDGALREFVAALTDNEKGYRAHQHLVSLAARSKNPAEFDNAFLAAGKTDPSPALTIAFGEFLAEAGRETDAAKMIIDGAAKSDNVRVLEDALRFFRRQRNRSGARAILGRIARTTNSAQRRIKTRIAVAESFADEGLNEDARTEALGIIRDYPTNYGAIAGVADFLRRAGLAEEAATVLRDALGKSRGRFKSEIAKNLAETLTASGKPNDALAEISKLHRENPANIGVFESLLQTAIRSGDAEMLRTGFDETLKSLRASSKQAPQLQQQIAGLRRRMIDAFTRLEDFDSAIDQYIELINRDPADESLTESAIRYTERRGGGARLLAYYEQLAASSFRNYRWNVVLARLKRSNGDVEGAIAEYDKAILNRPEMSELQLAVAEIEVGRTNFGGALARIDKALGLTNDDPAILRRKIEVLKLAGRESEVEAVRAKIPPDASTVTDRTKFDAARRAALDDRNKSREIYRAAFEELRLNPMSADPKAADIKAYADAVRGEVSLATINSQLWEIRSKLVALAAVSDTNNALEARRRVSIIETALVETIGAIAASTATDAELAALHQDLESRPDAKSTGDERVRITALVTDLSRRCGFGDIEERSLIAAAERDAKANHLSLVDFYLKRGSYRKATEAAVRFGADAVKRAETARLSGDLEIELAALNEVFNRTERKADLIDRYLEILLRTDRAKLSSLASSATRHPFAVINFFVRRGMADDAHRAVDAAQYDDAWKVARHAQIVYALNERGERAEKYFDAALKFAPIGILITRDSEASGIPSGEDWFRIASDFGRWNRAVGDRRATAFLPALTEALPESATEQFRLGTFLLGKGEHGPALERFRLAVELDNQQSTRAAYLAATGAAKWKLGDRADAAGDWKQVVDRKDLGEAAELIRTLADFGLAAEARDQLIPLMRSQREFSDPFAELVTTVAATFTDDAAMVAYFLKVCDQSEAAADIAEAVAERVPGVEREGLLAVIIRADREPIGFDRAYEDAYRRAFRERGIAEAIYDHETEFNYDEPDSARLAKSRELIESMMKRKATRDAERLLADAESWLEARAARPAWMRAMRIRIDAASGKDVLAAAERFVGIDAPDAVDNIRRPNLERFNRVLEYAPKLAESYFARRLALGDYDASNFVGLARATSDRETAKKIIGLMTEIAGDRRDSAARVIASLPAVKAKSPDPARYSADEEYPDDFAARLRIAAVVGSDVGDAALVAVYRKLLAEHPDAAPEDRIAYAKSIAATDRATAMRLLIAVADGVETPRRYRWRARAELELAGVDGQLPDIPYDAFSQFYRGVFEKERRVDRFVNSLLADPSAVTETRPELVKAYAAAAMPFAALELAKSLSGSKSDDVLDALSTAAESVGEFEQALGFERSRSDGGRPARIKAIEALSAARPKPATDLVIDERRTSEQ